MSRIAFICSEPLKGNMAGIAIRSSELSAALARAGFTVSLFAPSIDVDSYPAPPNVDLNAFHSEINETTFADFDVLVVQGHVGEAVLKWADAIPVVVDLYDPYLIENAYYHEALGTDVFESDFSSWQALLANGDFFLCANEQQKLFYSGLLVANRRIGPAMLNEDPTLSSLIGIVPFGVPTDVAPYQPCLPERADNRQRVLFGGLYDWYDPLTLLQALDGPEFENVEVIFVRNPNPDTTPQTLIREVEAWFVERQWDQARYRVIDWVPYERRYDLLRDVDVLVATHAQSLETDLSFRTRFLDAMRIGCPVICSEGGGISQLIATYGNGLVVAPNDVNALRQALEHTLSPQKKRSGDSQVQQFIADHVWDSVIAPLVTFCSEPKKYNRGMRPKVSPLVKESESVAVRFSVVLPTYNRMDILPEVLDALEKQHNAPPFEVIIVNDGSTDGTKDWLTERVFTIPVNLIHQENGGPARARNRAIDEATGDYIVLLGDDTVPDRYWLSSHYEAHLKRGMDADVIVVGQIDWHKKMRITPFIDFVDETGWQFAFDQIEDTENLAFNYFYGSNLSLATDTLRAEKFNTAFPFPAWEDSELGYRLHCRGCRFVFEHSARTHHYHKTTLARFADRQMKAGYCAMVFNQLHPEIGALVWPNKESLENASGKLLRRLRKELGSWLEWLPISLPGLWNLVLRDHYVAGIKQYLDDHAVTYEALSTQEIFPIVYRANSPVLHHHTGTREDQLWVCDPAEHSPGHCLFGPNYRVSTPASMMVTFYLQSTDALDDTQQAVTIDIYDNINDQVIGERLVTITELEEHPVVEVAFEAQKDQQLEFRIFWHGHCTLKIDKVCLDKQ